MLGLSKLERTLNAIAKGEPFTISYSTYRLFHKDEVIRPEYGYDSPVISHSTQMMKLESSSRPLAGRQDLRWTDYRWESCNLGLADIVAAVENATLSLGIAEGQHHTKRYFAYSGDAPRL